MAAETPPFGNPDPSHSKFTAPISPQTPRALSPFARAGHPAPAGAGSALMLRYLLVTNNTGEFERVPAREVENWVHTAQ
jgi:hypothetical protein